MGTQQNTSSTKFQLITYLSSQAKGTTTKEEVLAMLMKRTDQVKKLETKISGKLLNKITCLIVKLFYYLIMSQILQKVGKYSIL